MLDLVSVLLCLVCCVRSCGCFVVFDPCVSFPGCFMFGFSDWSCGCILFRRRFVLFLVILLFGPLRYFVWPMFLLIVLFHYDQNGTCIGAFIVFNH